MTRTGKVLTISGGLVGLLILVGILGNVLGWFGGGESGEPVEMARAERRTLVQTVTASGRIEPETEVKLSPDVSGEIIELTVKEGDQVVAGQVLARIKPDLYASQIDQLAAGVSQSVAGVSQSQAAVNQAEAGVASAQATFERAQREFERVQQLFDRGLVARAEFETSQAQLRAQQAAVNQAQAALSQARAGVEASRYSVSGARARLGEAQNQLSRTTIVAPMTGTVSQLNVELGERVVGTSQMAGTEILRIARLETMELVVDVNENDIVNVAVGDSAKVEVDAYPDRPLPGVVTEIAQSSRAGGAALGGQGGQQVTNFQVRVRVATGAGSAAQGGAANPEIPAPPPQGVHLRPGMSGTVDIFTRTARNAVAIPLSAVTVRDLNKVREDSLRAAGRSTAPDRPVAAGAPREENLRKVVFVVRDGKVSMRQVETGIDDRTYVEIVRGLQPGETVVSGPYSAVSRTLQPGQAVRQMPNTD
ncbi:MAG TPA: efflux RND transporter periplasmic adaptor subunit [Rhodothermales bacterium]|nr:efflux RND transporter periplasmic adaptor subunit [Rhodothermales bacterium]